MLPGQEFSVFVRPLPQSQESVYRLSAGLLHRSFPATVQVSFCSENILSRHVSSGVLPSPLTSESPNHRRSDNCTLVLRQPILVVSYRCLCACTVCAVPYTYDQHTNQNHSDRHWIKAVKGFHPAVYQALLHEIGHFPYIQLLASD